MSIYTDILKKYWGYDQFRPLQENIIESVASGKDTLGLMPTGGGKSLTFQVPAMSMEGVCIVITPLIALMKDQVENLSKSEISAAAIFAGLSRDEVNTILDNAVFEAYKFLYVSPERLSTTLFLEKVKHMKVSMIAVDESHCISQWGYDFRPSYLKIADIREHLPGIPVLALTATATPDVVDDIQERLGFPEKNVFRKSFHRSNLAYVVRKTENKEDQLLQILKKVPGTSVVYVRNRKRTKEIADLINAAGISAEHFHAGLSNEMKDARQLRWKKSETRVIVSTNAFGMGIDKSDVRSVVHLDLPDSPEAYFQEAGRAGRDEKKAYAVLLYNQSDITKLKKRIADSFPPKEFVLKTYEALGNYYQIGAGSGLDAVFPFDLADFCHQFKLPILMAHHALHILQYAGYLELTDEQDNSSRLMILAGREELYGLKLHPEQDQLMHILLRSYTGLFTEPAYINEDMIAGRLSWTRDRVYEQLKMLAANRIIQYIPRKKTPFITFIREREETSRVNIGPEAYEIRKDRYVKKISGMMQYATEENICRSKLLLAYFGDKDLNDCGQCDVCLAKSEKEIRENEFQRIRVEILKLLQDKLLNTADLVKLVPYKEQKIMHVLRFMMDQGEIQPNRLNQFQLTL